MTDQKSEQQHTDDLEHVEERRQNSEIISDLRKNQELANLSFFENIAESMYDKVTLDLCWRSSRGELRNKDSN